MLNMKPFSSVPVGSTPSSNTNSSIKPHENPWYPLTGPPTTPAEKALVEKHIQEELHQLNQLAKERESKSKDIEILALSNCADLKLLYHECLYRGSWTERSGFCQKQKGAWLECVDLQKV